MIFGEALKAENMWEHNVALPSIYFLLFSALSQISCTQWILVLIFQKWIAWQVATSLGAQCGSRKQPCVEGCRANSLLRLPTMRLCVCIHPCRFSMTILVTQSGRKATVNPFTAIFDMTSFGAISTNYKPIICTVLWRGSRRERERVLTFAFPCILSWALCLFIAFYK